MKILVPFSILFVTLTACESGAIKDKYAEISSLIQSGDNELIYGEFDEATHLYFTTLREAAMAGKPEAVETIGRVNEIPISTYMIYDLLEAPVETRDSMKEVLASESMLKLALRINSFGVFRNTLEHPIYLQEVDWVGESLARAIVVMPMGEGLSVASEYKFVKENEEWKLHFLSTMTTVEKIFAQEQRRSGMDQLQYARAKNRSVEESIQFQYRRNN